MPTCVPMKELKNTAEFTETVQRSATPVFVTKNGREEFVSMSLEAYEALLLEGARSRLYAEVDRAERDIADGRLIDAKGSSANLRERYGL